MNLDTREVLKWLREIEYPVFIDLFRVQMGYLSEYMELAARTGKSEDLHRAREQWNHIGALIQGALASHSYRVSPGVLEEVVQHLEEQA